MATLLSPVLLEGDTPGLMFHWCPGCEQLHSFFVDEQRYPIKFKWDGNAVKPKVSPSIRLKVPYHLAKDRVGHVKDHYCHYHINEGMLEFSIDCHHEFKGQKVPMPDIPANELW